MKKFILISLFLIMLLGTALYAQVDVTMGAGGSNNIYYDAPTPYGTWYKSFRQQYLYTADELNNAGGGAGNIHSLAFNVQNPNTCSAMPGFTIRIKETSQTALSGAFETGDYTTVFEQDGFQPVSGWNTHNFIAPFNWNGSSNILVDIYSNLVSDYTQNASVYYTPTTGVNTALRYQTDSSNAIDFTGTDTTASTYRANTRFNMMAFQATTPPNATTLIAPLENATFIPITGTTLSWNPASGAPTGYKVYLGTSPTIGTLVDVGTDLSYPTGTLDPGTDYYWQVVPYNDVGDASVDPNDTWMFTTVPEGTIVIGGGTATSRFPLGSYYGYERSAALYTATEIGAGNKRISEFGWYATLTHNAAVPTKIYLKTYPEDTLSSDTWANMINGATTVYDATRQGIDANDWHTIQLDRTFDLDSGNNLLVLVERNYGGGGGGTGANAPGIKSTTISGMHYTWQADTNPPTVVGSIQSTRPNLLFMASSYEISGPPNPAVLLYPTDGEPNIPLDAELRWTSGGGAPAGYKLYISENDPPDFYRDMGADITYQPDFLEYEKTYYWRIVPYNVNNEETPIDDCDIYSFSTVRDPIVHHLPWNEGFEKDNTQDAAISGWTQAGTAGSSFWKANTSLTTYNRTPRSGNWNAYLQYSNTRWMLKGFELKGGTAYQISLYARQDANAGASLKIAYGDADTPAAMTNTIMEETAVVSGDYQELGGTFSPANDGVYYIGILASLTFSPYYISIDDISVYELLDADPAPPILVGPIDGTEGMPIDGFDLQWQPNLVGGLPDDYLVYLSMDEQAVLESVPFVTANTSYNPVAEGQIEFAYEETWYWTVKARRAGVEVASDDVFSFTIVESPVISSFPFIEGFEDGYTHDQPVLGHWEQIASSAKYWTANNTHTDHNRRPRNGEWNACLIWGG